MEATTTGSSSAQGGSGGKLHVFMSSRPSAGAHALQQRDAPMGAGSKDPLTIMAPASKDYKDIAITAADAQVLMQLQCYVRTNVCCAQCDQFPCFHP